MRLAGIVLLVIGLFIGIPIGIILLSTDHAIPVLEPLFCDDNDALIRVTETGEDTKIVDYYCVDDDGGAQISKTGLMWLIIILFVLTMPVGIVLFAIGQSRNPLWRMSGAEESFPINFE